MRPKNQAHLKGLARRRCIGCSVRPGLKQGPLWDNVRCIQYYHRVNPTFLLNSILRDFMCFIGFNSNFQIKTMLKVNDNSERIFSFYKVYFKKKKIENLTGMLIKQLLWDRIALASLKNGSRESLKRLIIFIILNVNKFSPYLKGLI